MPGPDATPARTFDCQGHRLGQRSFKGSAPEVITTEDDAGTNF